MKLLSYKIIFFYIITHTAFSQTISYNLEIGYTIFFNTERPTSKQSVLYIDCLREKSLFVYGNKTESTIKQNDDSNYSIIQSGIEKFNLFNLKKDSLFSKEKTFNEEFIVAEKLPQLNWVLVEGEKKFGEIVLKKATVNFRGRDYIAWYSENYPIKFGPWKFYGLPGLIIEVHDTTKRYHWLATSIENTKTDLKQNKITNYLENDKIVDLKYFVEKRYNRNSGFLDESRLPRGTKITRGETPRNGIEIKFEWEEKVEVKKED